MSADDDAVQVELWTYANEVLVEFDRKVDRYVMTPEEARAFASAMIRAAEAAIEKKVEAAEQPTNDREGGH